MLTKIQTPSEASSDHIASTGICSAETCSSDIYSSNNDSRDHSLWPPPQLLQKLTFRGNVIEWGTPAGHWGRKFVVAGLRFFTGPVLWIRAAQDDKQGDEQVLGSTWKALQVDLNNIFFLKTHKVHDIHLAFRNRTFSLIVIDNLKSLNSSDFSYLKAQARRNQYTLYVLRNYFLSSKQGNPFADLRLNTSFLPSNLFKVQVLKGSRPATYHLTDMNWENLNRDISDSSKHTLNPSNQTLKGDY